MSILVLCARTPRAFKYARNPLRDDASDPMDWLLFVRGRSFQGVGVLAVEHELTSLVMHRRPRGYDARVSLRCQLSDFELGIQRAPRMHFFQEPTRGARNVRNTSPKYCGKRVAPGAVKAKTCNPCTTGAVCPCRRAYSTS
jgi:hypothetical protein